VLVVPVEVVVVVGVVGVLLVVGVVAVTLVVVVDGDAVTVEPAAGKPTA